MMAVKYSEAFSYFNGGKMRSQNSTPVQILTYLAKLLIALVTGGILVHLLIMFLDYYLMTWPLYLNLHENFMGSIFSAPMIPMMAAYGLAPMIPMMAAYGLFSLLAFFLWKKLKKAALLAHEKDVQNEKVNSVLKSMQRMTGMLAEHIAIQNSQILNWIEFQKTRGRTVSEKVQKPSEKIAKALQSLSEISFILPYSDNRVEDPGEIEDLLQGKLFQIDGYPYEKDMRFEPLKEIQR
jgi:hypothetical protein